MIVDCAAYVNGERREGDLSLKRAGEAAGEGGGTFVWVGVYEPSEAEFKAIAEEFGLHELAVEDAVRAHQRPKLEAYGETIHMVVKPARYVDPKEVIDVGELSIFVGSGFVITVRHGKGDLSPVRERLEARPDLLGQGPGAVLYAIVDHVVDRYIEAAQGFDEDVRKSSCRSSAKGRTRPSESTGLSARSWSSRPPPRPSEKRWKNSAAATSRRSHDRCTSTSATSKTTCAG